MVHQDQILSLCFLHGARKYGCPFPPLPGLENYFLCVLMSLPEGETAKLSGSEKSSLNERRT